MSGGGFGMLVLEPVLRIRREFASGKAIKAVARDLRLSRKVVRKAIREPDAEFAYRRAVQPLPRLGRVAVQHQIGQHNLRSPRNGRGQRATLIG